MTLTTAQCNAIMRRRKNAGQSTQVKPYSPGDFLTLPYPPSTNRYWRRAGTHVHKSNEARAYQQHAATLAMAAGMKPLAGPVGVTLHLYRPAKRGDLDNGIKPLLDALKGIAFIDDAQVTRIEAERHDDKANPRVEIAVTARAAV